jgi:hypothetical protein
MLELLGPAQRTDVDRAQAAIRDELRDLLLGVLVVAGDQTVELPPFDLSGDEGSREGGVEGLDHSRPGRKDCCDLLHGRRSRRRRQAIRRLRVDRFVMSTTTLQPSSSAYCRAASLVPRDNASPRIEVATHRVTTATSNRTTTGTTPMWTVACFRFGDTRKFGSVPIVV